MREKGLQRKILQVLRRHGGWWVKYHIGGRYSQSGVPDIIGCYKRRFVAIEVKLPGNKPTPLQAKTHTDIREKGLGIVRIAETVDDALALVYAIDGRLKNG